MKRLLTLLALVLCSCAETFVGEEIARPNNENLPDLTAAFAEEDNTRTYIEDGKYLRWHEDDRLTIFFGNTLNRQYKFNGKTGDNSGTFSLVPDGMLGTGNAFDHIYALYPYNADARITDEGVISLTLPAVQNYAENSFGRGANTMIAVTENLEDTFLAFKNACGYLKLRLYNAEGATIKSIEVKGNSGERLAGAATATIAFGEAPVLAMADDATTSVILNCGEGVALGTTAETATEFWFVLPTTTFTEGLTITATDTEGGVFEKSTTNEVIIERNAIQPMAAVKHITKHIIPNNEIHYIATSKINTYWGNEQQYYFGANIVSHEWDSESGLGVINFDGDVTKINGAFMNCYSLKHIMLPNSVTSIGSEAFMCCSSLEEITLPDGVQNIGGNAFYECRLQYINIPRNVTNIGYHAFYHCFTSNSIMDCEAIIPPILEEHAIVNSPGKIYVYEENISAYRGTWGTTMYNFIADGHIPADTETTTLHYTTSDGQLITMGVPIKSNYYNSEYAEMIIYGTLKFIREGAFSYKTTLTGITIPESVTKIGARAFYNCGNLKSIFCESITPPTLLSDDDGDRLTFYSNADERKIYVPAESVEAYKSASYWEDYADDIVSYDFENNEVVITEPATNEIWYTNGSTTEATNPYSSGVEVFGAKIISNTYDSKKECWVIKFDGDVTKIGNSAFYTRRNLTSVTIPNSATKIGQYAFCYCSNLTSITIPDSITYIAGDVFTDCNNLTSVHISDIAAWCNISFYNWDSNPLYYAHNLYLNKRLVTSLHIPNSVTTIGEKAFYGCSSLTSITIPYSVTTIGKNAFRGCSCLTSLSIPYSVTKIENYAFYDCSSLTSVAIPNSVTEIGEGTFSGCSSLTSVTIPNSITLIRSNAFKDCNNLKSVYISDIAAWCYIDFATSYANPLSYGANLYLNNALITDLAIPDSVTEIGSSAFQGCSSLTSVTIPDSVTTIGYAAFSQCSSLTSVTTIGDSVTAIRGDAFNGCSSLTSVTIPNSVTTIGDYAFYNCSSLTSVTIPNSVTYIGERAFYGCSSLTSVYCKAITPPAGDYDMFYKNASGRKIYVPMESVEAYKIASYWSSYASDIVGYEFENNGNEDPESGSYTVVLNNAWRQSTSVSNPDSSLYDGVYESYSNYNKDNGVATMYIDIEGYTEFSIYVRSDAESTYDYVTVSELDSTTQKMSTSGKQNSGTAISNYTKVTYTGIDGGKHRITVIYKKDSSQHSGTDRGYLIIPKNQ